MSSGGWLVIRLSSRIYQDVLSLYISIANRWATAREREQQQGRWAGTLCAPIVECVRFNFVACSRASLPTNVNGEQALPKAVLRLKGSHVYRSVLCVATNGSHEGGGRRDTAGSSKLDTQRGESCFQVDTCMRRREGWAD
jgi:hypothetical protein